MNVAAMAAEHAETVKLDKGSTGLGLSAEDPIGFKDGGDEEEEEVQVAKKPRVEKAVNGNNKTDAAEEEGVESVEKEDDDEPELDPLLAHNGNDDEERINGEGEEDEDSVGAAAEDDEDGEPLDAAVTSKDASAGDVGLRTLLQEGDTTKTGLVNGTEDAAHKLNGAK